MICILWAASPPENRFQPTWCGPEKPMQLLFGKTSTFLTAAILVYAAAANADRTLAVLLPPETSPPKEEVVPPETPPETEPGAEPENPFEESTKPTPYEETKRKREKTTIYIIVGVVLLLCLYWWTSGKLHHKIPQ